MKILIICTYFAPDTAIAAVRPYMFAKYLSEMGHEVTVLRSGKLNGMADARFLNDSFKYKVISYLGGDSPAEKFERNEYINSNVSVKSRISYLPLKVRRKVSKVYQIISSPVNFIKSTVSIRSNYKLQKKALERMKNEKFDVVFSTYADLENAYAGKYASELFACKWIMDFRDLIVQPEGHSWIWNAVMQYVQKSIVKSADAVTAVSSGLSNELRKISTQAPIYTVYNGYDIIENTEKEEMCDSRLTFCYTGQLYERRSKAIVALLEAIKYLSDKGAVSISKIRFIYAGPNSEEIVKLMEAAGVESILDDYGYVDGKTVQQLQEQSDVFLVLSWNTKKAQGILTGKFYEGIRSKKTIISLVNGDLANSELHELNQRYQYGFCYEQCNEKESFPLLCEYLLDIYLQKQKKGYVQHKISNELEKRFRYDFISEQLEDICRNLINEKK